jgi:hypothetical protein
MYRRFKPRKPVLDQIADHDRQYLKTRAINIVKYLGYLPNHLIPYFEHIPFWLSTSESMIEPDIEVVFGPPQPKTVNIYSSFIPDDPKSPAPMRSQYQHEITSALVASKAVPRIEAVLAQELAASGWTTNMRTYIQHLLRSGECTNYKELMARVNRAVRADRLQEQEQEREVNGVNGETNGTANATNDLEQSVKIPDKVVKEGIKAVRQEVEKVCAIEVDDRSR